MIDAIHRRAAALLPKQGVRPPWRLHQNYARDIVLRRHRRGADANRIASRSASANLGTGRGRSRERARAAVHEAIATGGDYAIEYRLARRESWISARGREAARAGHTEGQAPAAAAGLIRGGTGPGTDPRRPRPGLKVPKRKK